MKYKSEHCKSRWTGNMLYSRRLCVVEGLCFHVFSLSNVSFVSQLRCLSLRHYIISPFNKNNHCWDWNTVAACNHCVTIEMLLALMRRCATGRAERASRALTDVFQCERKLKERRTPFVTVVHVGLTLCLRTARAWEETCRHIIFIRSSTNVCATQVNIFTVKWSSVL